MKQKNQTNTYTLDLSKIDREGSFLCPNCKIRISPDDHSELVYSIANVALIECNIDEIVLYCKNCLCFIHLTGFPNSKKDAASETTETNKQIDPVIAF